MHITREHEIQKGNTPANARRLCRRSGHATLSLSFFSHSAARESSEVRRRPRRQASTRCVFISGNVIFGCTFSARPYSSLQPHDAGSSSSSISSSDAFGHLFFRRVQAEGYTFVLSCPVRAYGAAAVSVARISVFLNCVM